MTFQEAEITLICRKIYAQDLDRAFMPAEVVEKIYAKEEPHRMFIGEVVGIVRK